jgi:acylphosphatase
MPNTPSCIAANRTAGTVEAVTEDDGRVRRRLRITGRVQGVWFRGSAEREAARLRVTGFARNERDGSVTVEAEGSPAAVSAMEAWCRIGPAHADVIAVEGRDVDPLGSTIFDAR